MSLSHVDLLKQQMSATLKQSLINAANSTWDNDTQWQAALDLAKKYLPLGANPSCLGVATVNKPICIELIKLLLAHNADVNTLENNLTVFELAVNAESSNPTWRQYGPQYRWKVNSFGLLSIYEPYFPKATRENLGKLIHVLTTTESDNPEKNRLIKRCIDLGADLDISYHFPERGGSLSNSALHAAMLYGDRDTVSDLLAAGANPAPINSRNETPLDMHGHWDDKIKAHFIKTLFEAITSFESGLKPEWTRNPVKLGRLIISLLSDDGREDVLDKIYSIIRSCLRFGENNLKELMQQTELKYQYKRTALYFAIENNYPDIIGELIKADPDVILVKCDKKTPYDCIKSASVLKIYIDGLVSSNCPPDMLKKALSKIVSDVIYSYSYHLNIEHLDDKIFIITKCLDFGADANFLLPALNTAHTDKLLPILLSYKANINSANLDYGDHNNVLEVAVWSMKSNNLDVYTIFKDYLHTVDREILGKFVHALLVNPDFNSVRDNSLKLVRLCIQLGADLNIFRLEKVRTFYKEVDSKIITSTSLHAAMAVAPELISEMIHAGANPIALDSLQRTPLEVATNIETCIDILTKEFQPASLEDLRIYLQSLMRINPENCREMVATIINQSIETCNDSRTLVRTPARGTTLLHDAMKYNWLLVVPTLLYAGADIAAVNAENRRAYDLALERNLIQVMEKYFEVILHLNVVHNEAWKCIILNMGFKPKEPSDDSYLNWLPKEIFEIICGMAFERVSIKWAHTLFSPSQRIKNLQSETVNPSTVANLPNP